MRAAPRHGDKGAQHSLVLQELVDAAVLACTKTRRLCSMALVIFQRMIANRLLSSASRRRVIETLQWVSSAKQLDDEGIKLKLLQTCLSILQLPDSVADADEARQVLLLCAACTLPQQRLTTEKACHCCVRL